MKMFSTALFVGFILGACRPAFGQEPAQGLQQELKKLGAATFTAHDYKPGTIRHVVLFRYKNTVTREQKNEVIKRFLNLKNLAKHDGKTYIVSIETGANISGEGADQGLEQGFIVTFKSQGDKNYYVGSPVVNDTNYCDPAHQDFKNFVGPLLDQKGALVFDFAIKDLVHRDPRNKGLFIL